jgi:hypothetical protein
MRKRATITGKVRTRVVRSKGVFFKYQGIGNPKIGSGKKNINRWLRSLRGK